MFPSPAPPMAAPDSGHSLQQTLPSSPLSQEDPEVLRESERYLRTGVAPPPKADNCSRFKSFIDRINRRQWELLSDGVQARVEYNKHDLSLYDFTQMLKQDFPPKTNITMDIITSLGGDANVDGPVGARLGVKTSVIEGPCLPSTTRQHFEHARHMFVYFTDNKISQIYDFSDAGDTLALAQTIVPPPSLRPPPSQTSIDMRQFYADYIACINSGRMAEELDQFCKPSGVVWNGTHMAVQQYGQMIQSSLDAISGLFFDIHTLIADEGRQQLAARLEFTGTPVKPFAGGVPNGRPVAFSEHVFYWLEQGKISHVLSIVDWEEYRSQLAR
jgi:predicted ester cyclase